MGVRSSALVATDCASQNLCLLSLESARAYVGFFRCYLYQSNRIKLKSHMLYEIFPFELKAFCRWFYF